MLLSIIIPLYNEEKTISVVLEKIEKIFKTTSFKYEVVIVDDGSKDNSVSIIEKTIKNLCESYKLYRAERNQGKGAAIRLGLQYATGEYVVIQDADLEYDPRDILTMIEQVQTHKLNVLYGSRILNKQNQCQNKMFYLGGRLVTLVANILFLQNITDEPTCYKMFKTDILRKMELNCNGFEFCPEVTAKISKMGYKIKEIPISYYPRTIEEGKKISWLDGVEAIWTLVRYRFSNK